MAGKRGRASKDTVKDTGTAWDDREEWWTKDDINDGASTIKTATTSIARSYIKTYK